MKMVRLLSTYKDIGFTILPHSLNSELQQELVNNPGKHVIGYVTYNKDTNEYKFFNTKSQGLTESEHWSLDILRKSCYCEHTDTLIVFDCPPQKTKVAFQHILHGEAMRIDHWDTWSIDDNDAKVAVVTSWEII